jgi:hypothetical protein
MRFGPDTCDEMVCFVDHEHAERVPEPFEAAVCALEDHHCDADRLLHAIGLILGMLQGRRCSCHEAPPWKGKPVVDFNSALSRQFDQQGNIDVPLRDETGFARRSE